MLRSSQPPPVSSMASQVAASVTIAAMKRHCTRLGGRCSIMRRSTAEAAARCAALELHPRANAYGPRPSGHYEGPRAASTSGLSADVDSLVEDVRAEQLHAPFRPVQPGKEVDQGRGVQFALEYVRVLEITASGGNQLDQRAQRR